MSNEPFDFMSDFDEGQKGSVPAVATESAEEEIPLVPKIEAEAEVEQEKEPEQEKEIKWEDADVSSLDKMFDEEDSLDEKGLREEEAKKSAADAKEESDKKDSSGVAKKPAEGEQKLPQLEVKKEPEVEKKVEDSPELLALRKQVEELTKASDAQKQREVTAQAEVAAKAQQKQVAEQKKAGDKIPEYAFQVPTELMAGMASEDAGERQQAVGSLIQGTAQAVHKTVVAEIKELMANSFNQMPNMFNQMFQMRSMQRKIHDDFYGAFPDLNKPELTAIVQQVGKQIAEKYNSENMTKEMRDEIGFRVRAIIGNVGIETPPTAPAQAAQPLPLPKAPVISGGGKTRAGVGQDLNEDEAFRMFHFD